MQVIHVLWWPFRIDQREELFEQKCVIDDQQIKLVSASKNSANSLPNIFGWCYRYAEGAVIFFEFRRAHYMLFPESSKPFKVEDVIRAEYRSGFWHCELRAELNGNLSTLFKYARRQKAVGGFSSLFLDMFDDDSYMQSDPVFELASRISDKSSLNNWIPILRDKRTQRALEQ